MKSARREERVIVAYDPNKAPFRISERPFSSQLSQLRSNPETFLKSRYDHHAYDVNSVSRRHRRWSESARHFIPQTAPRLIPHVHR